MTVAMTEIIIRLTMSLISNNDYDICGYENFFRTKNQ